MQHVHIVVTWKGDLLGRLARRFGLTWTHAALRYVRDESQGARIIEAAACAIRERVWEEFIPLQPPGHARRGGRQPAARGSGDDAVRARWCSPKPLMLCWGSPAHGRARVMHCLVPLVQEGDGEGDKAALWAPHGR